MSDTIYSYHNFLFPFRFDKIINSFDDKHDFYKNNSFDQRVIINDKFKAQLEKNGWNYDKFKVKTNLDYNEMVYFHDFVKDTLYNTQDFKERATSYYFSKTLDKDDYFNINIKDMKDSYKLKLKSVSLRVFDTGVAILSFELENYNYSNIADILKINDFGRRIYPQFLDKEHTNLWTEKTKESFLADSILVSINGTTFEENFDYKNIPQDIQIASYILSILGDTFTRDKINQGKYYIQPSIDDRMFVISWYKNSDIVQTLKNDLYKKSDRWYEYLFIDGNGKTVQSPKMQKKLITEASYDRWMNYGTLYGMSRYSFVSMSSDSFPLTHMQTMYFQMFTLLLAQRASILRFSDEVTSLSDIDNDELSSKTSSLYKNYIRFVNKLYFREITPQDQGLEIYNQARKILKIDEDIKDLDKEIEELHNYIEIKQQNKINKNLNRLQYFGFPLLVLSFFTGFFGMNILPQSWIDLLTQFLEKIF